MKRYLITGLLVLAIPFSATAQGERVTKPVTTASLTRSLLTLAAKAEASGKIREASIIMQAAEKILNSQATK